MEKERVRAIIVENNKILLIKRIKEESFYWTTPGGGVEDGESRDEAIKRECYEELGVIVQPGKVFLERIADKPAIKGQKEFFYYCDIIGGEVGTGKGPEFQKGTGYIGEYKVEWVELEKVSQLKLKPQEVKEKILETTLFKK